MIEAALQRAWRHRGPLALALLPLAAVFGALAAFRRFLYRMRLRRPQRLPVPVVVVGNVVAGGAGKTPVVIALVEHLQAQGIACGVISRGHGRSSRDCREVTAASTAKEVGDEPLLIARRTQVPIAVGARRVEAARLLLSRHPGLRVIVSDDGLQHLALARDLEICVFDQRGTGNGWLLPAGPLREPWPRHADLVLRPPGTVIEGFTLERGLAAQAQRADGTRIALAELARGPAVIALAALAQPEPFFSMLRASGFTLARTLERPDHDPLEPQDLHLPAGATVVCTEKDAVKLWRHHPQAWAVPLALRIEPAFWDALDRRLAPRL
ncbi:tetraacyldisaccharide 4'-kinase [Ramlibacter rhizophilus]|uniref:Tetraacyldisaccharide 4'-kinase n=1 Tax=Ramlibacter rhizophilus TaxID=1781167 RepID=A0A4Z0BZJ0_9BURK|nr:tetraacyldisaccharide 4'-kinase [Ramlibacter rhizophilus]TFZ04767.1 tetraacyldisaccharide 4'-kinase [Ramlibacter rhizophilus]